MLTGLPARSNALVLGVHVHTVLLVFAVKLAAGRGECHSNDRRTTHGRHRHSGGQSTVVPLVM